MILATGSAEIVVPGREGGKLFEKLPGKAGFLLLERARGRTCSSANWPKTRPVAAAATAVPAPTSCFHVRRIYKSKDRVPREILETVGSSKVDQEDKYDKYDKYELEELLGLLPEALHLYVIGQVPLSADTDVRDLSENVKAPRKMPEAAFLRTKNPSCYISSCTMFFCGIDIE